MTKAPSKFTIMNKFLLIFSLTLFCLTGISAKNTIISVAGHDKTEVKLTGKSPLGFNLEIGVGEFSTAQIAIPQGEFIEIFIDGYSKSYKNYGEPHLPALSKLIEIPQHASPKIEIKSYTENIIDLNEYDISLKLMPSQPSFSKSDDPEYIFDPESYQVNSFNDAELATITTKGQMRGVQIGNLTINNIRYNPVTNQLLIYNDLVIDVTFENADLVLTAQKKADEYSPMFESSFSQLINYQPLQNKDAITVYPITYLIVSDRMFESTLQPFIEWKSKKGFNVIIDYTDNIGTTTTAIHDWIYNQYQTASPTPTYVLLVGDVAQIPAYTGTTGSHPTDLYYCTFDGGSDYIPELYYGRFSVESTAELQAALDKIMMHELYTWPSDAFLDECVLVAGVDGSFGPTHGDGQIYYAINEYFNEANGYSTIYAYLYENSTHPYQIMSSTSSSASTDIISKVSQGVGFANYTAHCSEDGWADPSFSRSDITGLSNANEYPLMIGNCCLSNKFNTSDCFGEMLLYAENKGASGYIGASNNSLWDEDFYWSVGINTLAITAANAEIHAYGNTSRGAYDGLWHTHGESTADWFITAREMAHCGNLSVESSSSSSNVYYWEIYHLMGDPSMMAYLSIPSDLAVSYMDPIIVGETSLTVTTEQYAYVAISQNGVLLNAVYTGASTEAVLNFQAFAATGTADIVVTKQNRKPYIGTVEIINSASVNDAMASSVISPLNSYNCPQEIVPEAVIRNIGSDLLTSCTIIAEVNGLFSDTVYWSGSLNQYETDTIQFPLHFFTIGTHTFNVFTTLPNGVADDYPDNDLKSRTVNILDLPVTAEFTATDLLFCSAPGDVAFTNNSQNALTYLWNFGDGSSSTIKNPQHTFATEGVFSVSLIADAGVCGSDSIMKIDYVSIDPSNPCDYSMPATGANLETACSGVLFDPGGEAAYGNNQNSTFTISPINANAVTIEFLSFDVEPGASGSCNYDYVEIHDGVDIGAPSLGKFCNNNIPSTPITSSTGNLTIHFYSDVSVTNAGFEMTWQCSYPVTPPVCSFTSDIQSSCSGTINFTDLSTNVPDTWEWDFGDGTTSSEQHPAHTYTSNGVYTVGLTASNEFGDNTLVQTDFITVNMPDAPVVIDGSSCGVGQVSLEANATGTIQWFDSQTGGTLLDTGSIYTTPTIANTSTYWVESAFFAEMYNVGELDFTTNGGIFNNSSRYQIFDCFSEFTLVSVAVNASGEGYRTIQLCDSLGNVLMQKSVNIPNGISRVELNFNVLPGTNQQLICSTAPNLYRSTTGISYPYEVPGIVSITQSSAGTSYYYYFYDWEIKIGENCISPRVAANAFVYEQPTVTAEIGNESAPAMSDGYATLLTTGTSPFTYLWDEVAGSQTTETATGLSAGVYYVTITDLNGCELIDSITISTGIQALSASVLSYGDIDCYANCNGYINLETTGGYPPYEYIWSDLYALGNRTELCAGSYTVTVSDAIGSEVILDILINEPQPIALSMTQNNLNCNGTCNGEASAVNITGGTSPYQFFWNNGMTSESITNLCAGSYYCTVTDAHGCTADPIIVTITEPDALSFDIGTTDASTAIANDGSVLIQNIAGGTLPYSYFWDTGETTNEITGLATGQYCVTISDANNCADSTCVDVSYLTDISKSESSVIFSAYPNPTEGIVFISLYKKANSLCVCDILGREVIKINKVTNTFNLINVSHLNNGIYFIIVESDGKAQTVKLVLQK